MFIWFHPKGLNTKDYINLLVGIDDVVATGEGGYQFSFDGVERESFNDFLALTKEEFRQDSYPEPYIITGTFSDDFNLWYSEYQKNESWSRWLQIGLTKQETPQKMEVFQDDSEYPEKETWYLAFLSGIAKDDSDAKTLDLAYSWERFEPSTIAQIKDALSTTNFESPLDNQEINFNLYDVGQGNMSAITTIDNIPLIYYDLGGGFFWNAHTYPITKNVCWTLAKTIILSHWDLDHLETARRLFHRAPNQFNDKIWIAPIQNITPYYHKIATKIASRGHLLLWGNIPRIPFWAGELIKCTGPNKNHSGLALTVDLNGSTVLHPADAAYTHIPGILNKQYDGLVATHHGAEFPINNSPVPNPLSDDGNIAFSYGRNNSYHHPRNESVNAHSIGGWTNVKNTTNGSISFRTTRITETPCPNACDLSVPQSF